MYVCMYVCTCLFVMCGWLVECNVFICLNVYMYVVEALAMCVGGGSHAVAMAIANLECLPVHM